MIGWENNRDGDITMALSLKTMGSAGLDGYRSIAGQFYFLFILVAISLEENVSIERLKQE